MRKGLLIAALATVILIVLGRRALSVNEGGTQKSAPSTPVPKNETFAKKPEAKVEKEETNQLGSEQFGDLLESTYQSLPKVSDLKGLNPEQVHHTPSLVREASQKLGVIAQALHDDPGLAPQAADFYRRCAEDAEGVRSIRALCLSDLKGLDAQAAERAEVDEDVRNLADKV